MCVFLSGGACTPRKPWYGPSLIDACVPAGRFAIGWGNCIPPYVPVENSLTIVHEALG